MQRPFSGKRSPNFWQEDEKARFLEAYQVRGDVCKASLCCSEMLSLAQPIGSACPAIDRAYTARLKHAM